MNFKSIKPLLTGRVNRNIIFWLLFAFYHQSNREHFFTYYPVTLAVLIISYGVPCYIHNFFLIPKYLVTRRFGFYLLFFATLLCVTTVASFYATHFVNNLFPGLHYMGDAKNVALPFHVFPSLIMFCMLAFGKFFADAIQNQFRLEQLEQKQTEAELQSLRSQINPHFLFNALNTIYGMARRSDKETSEAVLKLSNILRHNLYECNDATIPIEREITMLEQYVSFAKLRLHNKDSMKMQIDATTQGQEIAPLLLLPFIENAIKHGLEKKSIDAWVDIQLMLSDNQLHFCCANSYCKKDKNGSAINSGIGLHNVRRRLELLYPKRYQLDIQDNGSKFIIDLKMNLE